MSKKSNKKSLGPGTIALNRKANHDYYIEQKIEAGMVLEGWEVKSIRDGRVQLMDSHVIFKYGEAFLLGSHITPLLSASTHVKADPTRTRKLLLSKKEINQLMGNIDRKGYTVVPVSMYWKHGRIKLEIGLAKGKKQHDKRASEKAKDWARDKQRLLKNYK